MRNGTINFFHKATIGEDAADGIYLEDGTKVKNKDGDDSHVAQVLTAAADNKSGSTVRNDACSVSVEGVVTDANDWIVLPALADTKDGHEITILCSAGANFEMRTPAASGEEINSEDCDGTKEYLCTDTEVMKVVKISNTIGWMAHAYSAIGAVVAAVVPD